MEVILAGVAFTVVSSDVDLCVYLYYETAMLGVLRPYTALAIPACFVSVDDDSMCSDWALPLNRGWRRSWPESISSCEPVDAASRLREFASLCVGRAIRPVGSNLIWTLDEELFVSELYNLCKSHLVRGPCVNNCVTKGIEAREQRSVDAPPAR